jgi:hypothetical protein
MDLRAILGIVVGAPTGRGACTAIEPTPTARSMVASAIRMVFEQPDEASARDQCTRVIAMFEPRMSAVARLLADAEPDLLSHFTFPELHRARIRSTNPQERLNKEIPVLNCSLPEGPRRRLVRWVTVPRPDSKEISGATSIWWLSAA